MVATSVGTQLIVRGGADVALGIVLFVLAGYWFIQEKHKPKDSQ